MCVMGKNFLEFWRTCFPLVSIMPVDEEDDSLYKLVKSFFDKQDIKGMIKELPFSNLLPYNEDPANKHFGNLEMELEEGKLIDIIKYFLKIEEKIFEPKFNQIIKDHLVSKKKSFVELFIEEIVSNKNWIIFNYKENKFEYNFSNIIKGKYKPASIYDAFRCYVPRYCAFLYIKNPQDYTNDHVIRAIESIKNNTNYFVPTQEYFEKMIIDLMPFGEDVYLKSLDNEDSTRKETWNDWNYWYIKLKDILSTLELNKELERIESEKNAGINSFVDYTSKLIYTPIIRNVLESQQENKNSFSLLEAKINKHYEGKKSIFNTVEKNDTYKEVINRKYSKDDRIDEIGDEYIKYNENNEILLFGKYLSFPNDELENIRNTWRQYFIKSFGEDEYAQYGQANFSTNVVFKRYIKWLVPFIIFIRLYCWINTLRDDITKKRKDNTQSRKILQSREKALENMKERRKKELAVLLTDSDLFKDYCRVHELNGCKYCCISTANDLYDTAQSIFGSTYDISKCNLCSFDKYKENLLKPFKNDFFKRINDFIDLIKKGNNYMEEENE